MSLVADLIIRMAMRRAYSKGHLLHADGSLYMGRYSLFETRWLTARVHHLATPDWDRALHDHPWPFVSIVLRGAYIEARPYQIEPCFEGDGEWLCESWRIPGSLAFRRPTDRHRITHVNANTWTLFITGPKRQWWGFYTPNGKVHWRDYESVHTANVSYAAPGASSLRGATIDPPETSQQHRHSHVDRADPADDAAPLEPDGGDANRTVTPLGAAPL